MVFSHGLTSVVERIAMPNEDRESALQVVVSTRDFSDWESLLELLRTSFAYMDARIDPPSSLRRMGIDELRSKSQQETLILTITDSSKLIGCAFASVRNDCVYVGKIAVAAHARGRGVARQLIAVAETIARSAGRQALELQTRVELVENHKTFAALRFEKVAETAHPGYTRTTSITMRKTVTP
jgi:predicted GNAT superfamily acetyltransferase